MSPPVSAAKSESETRFRRGPLRVAIACEFETLNGGEQSLLAVLNELSRSESSSRHALCGESSDGEFVPLVLAPATGPLADALAQAGITHRPFAWRDSQGRRLSDESIHRQLHATCESWSPHLLHANSLSISKILGGLAKDLPVPCTGHLRDIVRLSRRAVGHLNGIARMVTVSKATRDFHQAQGVDGGRMVVIHNGIDTTRFHPHNRVDDRQQLFSALQLPDDALVAVTVGQICLRKGHDLLAAMAIELKDRLPRLHFLVVGERYSEKLESVSFERDFMAAFERAGMSQRLHRLGYRDDIPALMHAADLVIHPARQEPLGRVLLEAAGCGRPIIAANVGGTNEILEDSLSARLVTPGDGPQWADAVFEVLTSPSLSARLESGSLAASQRFRIADRARDLLAFWQTESRTIISADCSSVP
ncbi:MAG: glycosyltransferase family 4 protein [Planctomycetaceae bacterium]